MKRSIVTASAFAAMRLRDPLRPRHLAARAQGLEGRADRRCSTRAFPRRRSRCRPSPEQDDGRIPPRARCACSSLPAEQALVYTPAPRCAPMCRAPAIGCSRRRRRAAAPSSSIAAIVAPNARANAGAAPLGRRRDRRRAALAGGRGTYFTPRDEPANNVWYLRDPAGDRRCKELGRGRAVLHRAGSAAACRRAEARPAGGEAAQQPSAICDHLVRPRGVLAAVFAVWVWPRRRRPPKCAELFRALSDRRSTFMIHY